MTAHAKSSLLQRADLLDRTILIRKVCNFSGSCSGTPAR
jgi:hypothetical protein